MSSRKTLAAAPEDSERLASDVVAEAECSKFIEEYKKCRRSGMMRKSHCQESHRKMLECVFRTYG